MNTTAEIIKACAADKLQINRAPEDLLLAEIKSNGEKTIFKDHDVSIPTALCLNGRIFVAPKEQVDVLVNIIKSKLLNKLFIRKMFTIKCLPAFTPSYSALDTLINKTITCIRILFIYFVYSLDFICRHNFLNKKVVPMASKWTLRH